MSLTLALNNALTGLHINQQAIGVLSNNISNANTEGYSRQVLNQSPLIVNGVGSGVRLEDIIRKVDSYVQRSMVTQTSNNASAQTLDTTFQQLQDYLGKPGSGNSLDAQLTSFFNTMQNLAETPDTTSLKSTTIATGATLAKSISDLAASIENLRFDADRQIADSVTTINSSIDRLRSINTSLNAAKAFDQSSAGLLDERDKELAKIAQYMDISTSFGPSGQVTIVAGDGVSLLEEGVRTQLKYARSESTSALITDSTLAPLEVATYNEFGKQVGPAIPLIPGGKSSQIVSRVQSGSIAANQQIRDVKLPKLLEQLDMLASRLRDQLNALHNKGSGFPPATSLTGDRAVLPSDQFTWTGQVRIAVLQQNGKPVSANYADETYTGIRPLTLDLAALDSGQGKGKPTIQTIIDEINNHFGAPGNKAELGNLNNIQLVSDSKQLPSGAPPLFDFDLDLDNISTDAASVFVNGITVRDDTAANITNVTQTTPQLTVSSTNSFSTVSGTPDVTVNFTTQPNVKVGDKIYLNAPAGPVNGIPAASLTGYLTVTSVSGNTVTVTAGASATASGYVNDASSIQVMPPYYEVAAGNQSRTHDAGQMQVDFSGNLNSTYYDITVNVTVVDGQGITHTAPITYRVNNNTPEVLGKRYSATAVGAPGNLVLPNTSQGALRAILVDANGNELPKANGKYYESAGYLKLIGSDVANDYSVAIDELDSAQLGKPDGIPAEQGTGWGFSHYFGLNNFFDSNALTKTGDTVKNSALSLKVQDRLLHNASLLSTGNITLQPKNVTTNNQVVYTYERNAGDNSIAQRIAALNAQNVTFDAAGDQSVTTQPLSGYIADMLGSYARQASEATNNAGNAKALYDTLKSKRDSISGVNLDEELANTVIFQNAYAATARVVTTVNKMYDDLLQVF